MSFRRRNCCCGGNCTLNVTYSRLYDAELDELVHPGETEEVPTFQIWSDSVEEQTVNAYIDDTDNPNIVFKCGELIKYRVSYLHVEEDGSIYEFRYADVIYGCDGDPVADIINGAFGEFQPSCESCECGITIILYYWKIQDGPLDCYLLEGEYGSIGTFTCAAIDRSWMYAGEGYETQKACVDEITSAHSLTSVLRFPAVGFIGDSGVCTASGYLRWNYYREQFPSNYPFFIDADCPIARSQFGGYLDGDKYFNSFVSMSVSVDWIGSAATAIGYSMTGGVEAWVEGSAVTTGWYSGGGFSGVSGSWPLGSFYSRGYFRRAVANFARSRSGLVVGTSGVDSALVNLL